MTTVRPDSFAKVDYDPRAIAALVDRARSLVPGLPAGLEVEVRLDEERATTVARVVAREPWVFDVDGGAIEDTQRPRTLGEPQAMVVFCRLLFEVADRLMPGFDPPPVGGPTEADLRVAWDVYGAARTARLGVRVHQPKHRYDFRNRVGFTDAADACFDRLWEADALTWEQIVALVAAAQAPRG